MSCQKQHDIATWEEVKIPLKNKNEYVGRAGVYAIVSDNKALYIGSSINLGGRLYRHIKISTAEYHGYKNIRVFIYTECDNIWWTENRIIERFNPPFNTAATNYFYGRPDGLNYKAKRRRQSA